MNENIMKVLGFDEEVNEIKNNICPLCHSNVKENEFRNSISRKEFTISGMCQKCQDDVFGED